MLNEDYGSRSGGLPLNQTGRLEIGVHTYTLTELRPLLATTPYRRAMWNRFMAFLGWPVMVGKFSYAYMGGGFPTDRARPKDIDLVLQTSAPYGPEAFQVLERFFRVGIETIEEMFAIHLHFWMENAPPGVCDYKQFFQYSRPRKSPDFERHGLIRIALDTPTIKAEYREMVGGFELLDDTPPPGC